MDRRTLDVEQWKPVAPLLPGKAGNPGRTDADNRLFLEAVVWIAWTGAPWAMARLSGSTSMASARGGTQGQAVGWSRNGPTTKVVPLVDALGNLMRFVLLPGQRHGSVGMPPLIYGEAFNVLLADKALDADWLRADLRGRGAVAVIPPTAIRREQSHRLPAASIPTAGAT